jgi:hypothetical protein
MSGVADGEKWMRHLERIAAIATAPGRRQSSANQFQRRPPMQRNVVSLIALDLVLRVVFDRMMRVTFVVHLTLNLVALSHTKICGALNHRTIAPGHGPDTLATN